MCIRDRTSGEVTAEFTHGVLEVRVPKPAERKPRTVEIKTRQTTDASVQTPQPETSQDS